MDLKATIEKLGGKGAVVGAVATVLTGAWHFVQSDAEAKAELKVRKEMESKYETVISDNIRYKYTCEGAGK